MNKRILLVEDEKTLAKALKFSLEKEGFLVSVAYDGEEALQAASREEPQLIILDLMLPKIDGFEVCRTIRRDSQVPIIMLTARDEDIDKILGLELGADDYMVKPFNPLELIARIRANLRKLDSYAPAKPHCISFHQLKIDTEGQRFYKNNQEIELTPTEFALMKVFMSNPQKAFSRNEILDRVWGRGYFGDLKIVDVNIRRIREKLEEDPSAPRWIETVWGLGYRLKGEV